MRLRKFPDDVTDAAKKALDEVVDELSSKNEDFRRVYESAAKHLLLSKNFADISLRYFLNVR